MPRPEIVVIKARMRHEPEILRTMQQAFEEYRDWLQPPTGALTETLDDVLAAWTDGGAFLAYFDDLPVGSARYRLRNSYIYAERVAVIPAYRKHGVGGALMHAIENASRDLNIENVHLSVRASLPMNLRYYENLGYRAIESCAYSRGPVFEITLSKRIQYMQN